MQSTNIKLYQYDGLTDLPSSYLSLNATSNEDLTYPSLTFTSNLGYDTISSYTYLYDSLSKKYYWIKSISYDESSSTYIIYTSSRLLNDKVLGYDFYLNQLTLLLKRSYGVPEQVKLYVDILNQMEQKERTLLNLIGKYNEITGMYLPDIDKINSYSTTTSTLLDGIGNILNISRTFILNDKSKITLNNSEFFILIYMYVSKNNYDGRIVTLTSIYDNISKLVKKLLNIDFKIRIYNDYSNGATCNIILETNDENCNLAKLWNNDYFIIKAVGINYAKSISNFNKLGFFDSNDLSDDFKNSHCKWDVAYWG